jgi:hypothetical protein
VDQELERLIGGLRAAVDAGVISFPDAAQALGDTLLGAVRSEADVEGWRLELDAALVTEVLDGVDGAVRVEAGGLRRASDGDVDRVAAHVVGVLGDPIGWQQAPSYPSVALGVMDAIWSIGVRYAGVLNVISRYRHLRQQQGSDADRDTPTDLLETIHACGGADRFAEQVSNRQRTSSRGGILKAEAVGLACEVLRELRLDHPSDVRRADGERLDALRASWMRVPGQGSGISLDYFLMLCGMPGVKGDRMVRRFVARALGAPNELSVDPLRAVSLVQSAALRLEVEDRRLDFAIWQHESQQGG